MPKNGEISKIEEYLETLEDTTLYTKKSRTKCLESLKSIFDTEGVDVTPIEVQRILIVFMKCIKEDIQSLPHAITAISSLLTNVKVIPCIPVQDLLPSALALLHMLKTLCLSSGIDNLREMSFDVFLLYPVDVLSTLVTYNCSEILEIFNVYKPEASTGGITVSKELCVFLQKFLKLLPAEQRKQFVKEGVVVWFGELVPTIMKVVVTNPSIEQQLLYLECLETLADTLVHIDYFQCPQWQSEILECICCTQKYPLIMKNLLQNGSPIWHRLWILFVKILKDQITRMFRTFGTPINSMLSVVETAFKMDIANRCRAFECWDNLIDNFAKESNEQCLPKRIKLLLIPLKLNNAKTEETALAKFHTWWNLIRRFQSRLDKFTNEILFAFLHFTFGKEVIEKKTQTAGVSFLYESVKNLCLQALVQIVGHENCNCCTDVPKLNGKMLNIKLLTSHWDDWMCTLKCAINLSYRNNNKYGNGEKKSLMQILCIWKAFVIAIAELPPNGVRRDMFNGVIQVLIDLTKFHHNLGNLPEILFSLTLSLFEDDAKVKSLLVTSKDDKPLLDNIISLISYSCLHDVLKRYETEEMVETLKPMTNLMVEHTTADLLLDYLPPSATSLKLWTALVHSVKEYNVDSTLVTKLISWPLQTTHHITEDKYAALAWYTIYNLNVKRINKQRLEKDILETIGAKTYEGGSYFKLCLTMCLLKDKLVNQEDVGVLPEVLKNLTAEMIVYKEFEQVVPILVDTIVVLLNNLTVSENTTLAKLGFNCIQNVLKMAFAELKSLENEIGSTISINIFIMLNNIFNAIELLYEIPIYSQVNCHFVEVLVKEHALYLSRESSIFKFILTKLKLLLLNCSNGIVKYKINDSIRLLKEDEIKINNVICGGTNETVTEFTSPDVKKGVKKAKKKASIVNTVVENGEEYVVVKSNWTFNPKKLTENQKEKFQKKREDIPALYQDLSQSQDEFKMSRWKTDSQDTTSSNSKSTTNDGASNTLKNIPSSNVVPNIFENIRSENDKNCTSEPNTTYAKEVVCHLQNDKPKIVRSALSTSKKTKSPRMALKDRVFRNVRNLIEKSTTNNDTTEKTVGGLQVENVPNTPTTKPIINANLINSAPPLISTDRPSRMKRKPKKFDDVEVFGLKKRRNSQIDWHPNSSNDSTEAVMVNLNENNIDKNIDNEQNIVKAADNNEIKDKSVDQEIIVPSIETKEDGNSVIILPESEVTALSQLVATTDAPKAKAVESIAEDLCISEKNNDTQDIQISVVAQNDQINESKGESHDNNVTVELNVNTKNIADEIVTLNTSTRAIKPSQKSTTKKTNNRKSRIEKELAIDMVEGHPFLKIQSGKRLTRKNNSETESTNRRKTVTEKLNKSKKISKISPKVDRSSKEKDKLTSNSLGSISVTVEETQEKSNLSEDVSTNEDAPCSEDVIESSQDSTFTTISAKSTKRTPITNGVAVECQRIDDLSKYKDIETQELLSESNCEKISLQNKSVNQDTKDDIELPQNKTAEVDTNQSELTENMDTEPITNKNLSDVIIIDDDELPIIINSEKSVGPETQEIAEADTQPNDPADFVEFESIDTSPKKIEITNTNLDTTENMAINKNASVSASETLKDVITIAAEPNELLTTCNDKDTDMSSPFKDDAQRKQDFLNNTSEISPIKVQSPDKEKPSPPQETNSDYLVVKLMSPVQSNGEPFDKCSSPEFFTEDKTSPDKRDQSPPRAEVSINSGSPSSSLSLKKNRPQAIRPVGRAAHMLGLCVPDSLNTIKNLDRVEPEEPKKGNTSTPARRNLRVIYNTVADNSDNTGENEEQDNFLKFKKILPSNDSSPSVPILKRKLIDIVDDTTASPASKRKRVSFHDPPVSTTISVQKYIEPGCVISPSTAIKRSAERQTIRNLTKSPKRLENTFVKLDTVLSKALESFTDEQANSLTNDTNASLDVTPAVAIINTSELNDTDPICPDLVECEDSIENIAVELSSPAMKDLFIKELEGKVGTVGDLAKMTELEVNRLCIKAPKVEIAKKVLADYTNKRVVAQDVSIPEIIIMQDETALAAEMDHEMTESEVKTVCGGTQTDRVSVCETAMQTSNEAVQMVQTQTDTVCTAHTSMQTVESGFKATSDLISSWLLERPDFVEKLGEELEETSIRKISEKLPTDTMIDILANKSLDPNPKLLFNKILGRYSQNVVNDTKKIMEMSVLKDFLCDRFDNKDLILFCSQLLQTVYDKPA